MLTLHPITQPNTRPVYSQLSFTLLSYALSAAYNHTYAELLDKHIICPFNLNNTGVSPGNTSFAIIPPPIAPGVQTTATTHQAAAYTHS